MKRIDAMSGGYFIGRRQPWRRSLNQRSPERRKSAKRNLRG